MKNKKQTNFIIKKSKFFQYYKGFTLVELIVVIVILAILSTIAFISFNGYSWDARDSKRMSNVALISKWFDMAIAKWVTINTSESTSMSFNIELTWSWINLFWFFDSPIKPKLLNSIWINWWDLTLNDWFQSYRYTYIPSKRQYQVMWLLEKAQNTAFYKTILNQVFAEDAWYPFIKWNYFATGSILWLIPKSCDPASVTPCIVSWSWDVFIENVPVLPSEPIIPATWTWCIFDNTDSSFDTCTFSS